MADTVKVAIEPLDVDNYSTWAVRMKMLLIHKELWVAVASPDSLDVTARVKLDKALSLILLNVKDHHLLTLAACATPREAWDVLANTYQASNVARQMQLRKELNNLKKQATEQLTVYVARARALWADMSSAGIVVTERDVVMALLAGLPAEFDTAVAVIEASGPDLTFAAVLPRLLIVEQRVLSKMNAESHAFAARVNLGGGRSTTGRFTPSNRKLPYRQVQHRTRHAENVVCWLCGMKGHVKRDCPTKHASPRGDAVRNGVALTACTKIASLGWVLDSGASHHMTHDVSGLIDQHTLEQPISVVLGDGTVHTSSIVGVVQLTARVRLHDVLYVPELKTNLLSVKQATARGAQVLFHKHDASIVVQGKTVLRAEAINSELYCLVLNTGVAYANVAKVEETAELWHARFGHLGYDNLAQLASAGMVTGMHVNPDAFVAARGNVCNTCVLGKQSKLPSPLSTRQSSTRVLSLIHMDVCGPMPVPSLGGSMYVATFLDDFSKLSVVRPVASKADVGPVVKEVVAFLENMAGAKVMAVRSDHGGEYMSDALGAYFKSKGIMHQMSAPYTPEQNGAAERLNRTLLEKVRSMLIDAELPHALWAECIVSANYLRNRSPVHGQKKTPWEAFFGTKPDVSHLHVIGCKAFVHVQKQHRKKLDAVSTAGVFVGYEGNGHAFRVYVPDTGKVIISKHVTFDEHTKGVQRSDTSSIFLQDTDDGNVTHGASAHESSDGDHHDDGAQASEHNNESSAEHDDESDGDDGDANMADMSRFPKRARRKPEPWWIAKKHPRVNVAVACTASAEDAMVEPTTFAEAMQSPQAHSWKQAMDEEMSSLLANGTWELEKAPSTIKPIPVKWVFKVKRNNEGRVERFKARLVAKGFAQREGIDYNEVFAPVSKHTTLRAFLAMVAIEDMMLHQLDVKTAFLNGELEEDIWMQQPPGYELHGHEFACHLHKALYGLKQAPRAWQTRLKRELNESGFKASAADPSLYILDEHDCRVYVLVYVDDMLLACKHMEGIDMVKRKLQAAFDIHDLGEAGTFLGMEIVRDKVNHSLKLSQHRAVVDLVAKFGMSDAIGRSVPLSAGTQFTCEGELLDTSHISQYTTLVGSLLYLSICTRPDIAQVVGVLARYMSKPTLAHWQIAKGVVRYLAGTSSMGIMFGTRNAVLVGYCDADYAGDVDTRRSTTGYVFLLHGGAISWSSRLQATVAVSTVEAEYMSAAAAVKEALWLRLLLAEMHMSVRPVHIHCDNQGALKLLKHPIASQRSKHIDVLYHFAREKVASGDVEFSYCISNAMIADMFTKALSKAKFEFCRDGLGMVP